MNKFQNPTVSKVRKGLALRGTLLALALGLTAWLNASQPGMQVPDGPEVTRTSIQASIVPDAPDTVPDGPEATRTSIQASVVPDGPE